MSRGAGWMSSGTGCCPGVLDGCPGALGGCRGCGAMPRSRTPAAGSSPRSLGLSRSLLPAAFRQCHLQNRPGRAPSAPHPAPPAQRPAGTAAGWGFTPVPGTVQRPGRGRGLCSGVKHVGPAPTEMLHRRCCRGGPRGAAPTAGGVVVGYSGDRALPHARWPLREGRSAAERRGAGGGGRSRGNGSAASCAGRAVSEGRRGGTGMGAGAGGGRDTGVARAARGPQRCSGVLSALRGSPVLLGGLQCCPGAPSAVQGFPLLARGSLVLLGGPRYCRSAPSIIRGSPMLLGGPQCCQDAPKAARGSPELSRDAQCWPGVPSAAAR